MTFTINIIYLFRMEKTYQTNIIFERQIKKRKPQNVKNSKIILIVIFQNLSKYYCCIKHTNDDLHTIYFKLGDIYL